MPLNPRKTQAAFVDNIQTEEAAGKPPKQAEAIAYSELGEKRDRQARLARAGELLDQRSRR